MTKPPIRNINLKLGPKVKYYCEYIPPDECDDYAVDAYLLVDNPKNSIFYAKEHKLLYVPANPEDKYECDCLVIACKFDGLYFPVAEETFLNIKRQAKCITKKERNKLSNGKT